MIGPGGFMAAPTYDPTERIVKRMEQIRETLDEDDDLFARDRKELTHEYRLLNAELQRATSTRSREP
jgi:hypothetical protein